jgi:hypothetical protein
MRIQGKEIKSLNVELIVIPRGNGEDIIFKAQAVADYETFNKLCPEPEAPWIIKPGTGREKNYRDQSFVTALNNKTRLQTYYMFIKSLEATEGLTWDTIDINRPDTWLNFEKELQDAGFSLIERNLITQGCMIANCLNERKIEEARNRFIQSQAVRVSDASSPADGQVTTPSGGLANV